MTLLLMSFYNIQICPVVCRGCKIARKNRLRASPKKVVFSPPLHWLLCTEPSFDINWVKHEGGREGGQQLDPTVNVTLVSQLHQCQSLVFSIYFVLSSVHTSYLCVLLKMILWGPSEMFSVSCVHVACVQINNMCILTANRMTIEG